MTTIRQWLAQMANKSDARAVGGAIGKLTNPAERIVPCTTAALALSQALHDDKTIVLDRAAGIAVTLPPSKVGLKFKFVVKTTFTGAASIKSIVGTDLMVGHAIMGNDSDNAVVCWQALAASTFDTIDLFGTANSTGGLAGQTVEIECIAPALWHVRIIGDAGGSEATPFANTVT